MLGLSVRDCCTRARIILPCARKHSTMTLESDRPERGLDDRHSTSDFGVSGALPPFLENVSAWQETKRVVVVVVVVFLLSITSSGFIII